MQIHIPRPCGEDWNGMTPSSGGRHCAQCAKTVIDFTGMSAAEISLYLRLNAGNKICGRFTEDQLTQDIPTAEDYVLHVLRAPLPFLKQIAALIIFALFMGASPLSAQAQQKKQPVQHTAGAPVQLPQHPGPHPAGTIAEQKQAADTITKFRSPVMGKMLVMPPKATKPPKPQVKKEPEILWGDIQSIPDRQLPVSRKRPLPKQHVTGAVAEPAPPRKK